MKIKILQWNIWYREKPENIISLLRDVQLDIICLQELTVGHELHEKRDVPQLIGDALGMEYNFSPAHIFGNEYTQGNGIFSRFPIVSNDNFLINEPGEEESYSSEGRSCAVSVIKVGNDREITVGTAHSSYNHRFEENDQKKQEVSHLVEYFSQKSENVILTGDLNISPDAESIKSLEEVLKSVGPDMNEKTWTTKPFSYNGFEENDLAWRLDYAFASKDVRVVSSEILQTDYSDHLPILVEIEI